MAEGFAQEAGWQAFSAGTQPEDGVNPNAVKVMAESGIDIADHTPQSVEEYAGEDFQLVATVCNKAKESCPVFTGKYLQILHKSFEDPALVTGSPEQILAAFRNIRDEIKIWIDTLK